MWRGQFSMFPIIITEAILDVPEAIQDVPEAILCKNENKANSAQLGGAGAWAELGLSLAIKKINSGHFIFNLQCSKLQISTLAC